MITNPIPIMTTNPIPIATTHPTPVILTTIGRKNLRLRSLPPIVRMT